VIKHNIYHSHETFRDEDLNYHNEDDKPAIIYSDGFKAWFKRGKLHRIKGPAVEFERDKVKKWYLNDKYIPVNSQEEFEKYLKLLVFI